MERVTERELAPPLSPSSFHSAGSHWAGSAPASPARTELQTNIANLTDFVASYLDSFAAPKEAHPNLLEDVDVSAYLAGRSCLTPGSQQCLAPAPQTPQLTSRIPQKYKRTATPDIPPSIREQLDTIRSQTTSAGRRNSDDMLLDFPVCRSTPAPSEVPTTPEIKQFTAGARNVNAAEPLDLLFLSDSDFELLSGVESPASPAPLSTPAPPSQTEKQLDVHNSSQIDQAAAVMSFFDDSKPRFPAVPSGPTVKELVPTSEKRLAASVPISQLEDPDKKIIYVVFQGSCTPVSWFSDTANADVREMILCACDAMIDGGFVLREITEISAEEADKSGDDSQTFKATIEGREFHYVKNDRFEFEEFHKLKTGSLYVLEPATERTDLKQFTGDRWRRLRIKINPLYHIETLKALETMKKGSNLLKHTNLGFPHLRQFQLSADNERLLWYSTDSKDKTTVPIQSIKEIRLGQNSVLFQTYKLPSLEHLSLSIIYDATESHSPLAKTLSKVMPNLSRLHPTLLATLDLTCKDEFEFDIWVAGLKALVFAAHQMEISKEELLSHSRRFRRAIGANSSGIKLSALPTIKEPGAVGLEECLELPVHTLDELEKKLERLKDSCVRASAKLTQFDEQFNISLEKARSACNSTPGWDSTTDNSLNSVPNPPTSPVGPGTDSGTLPQSTLANVWFELDGKMNQSAHDEVFANRSEAEDDLLEYIRTRELQQAVHEMLETAANDVEESKASAVDGKSANLIALKKMNQLLWKAEVDIENVDDMFKRLIERRSAPINKLDEFSKKMGEFNTQVTHELHRVGEQISTALSSFFNIAPEDDIPRPMLNSTLGSPL